MGSIPISMSIPSKAPKFTYQTTLRKTRTILYTTRTVSILILTVVRTETVEMSSTDICLPIRSNLIPSTVFYIPSLAFPGSRGFRSLYATRSLFLSVSSILYDAGWGTKRKSFRFWITSTSIGSSSTFLLHITRKWTLSTQEMSIPSFSLLPRLMVSTVPWSTYILFRARMFLR